MAALDAIPDREAERAARVLRMQVHLMDMGACESVEACVCGGFTTRGNARATRTGVRRGGDSYVQGVRGLGIQTQVRDCVSQSHYNTIQFYLRFVRSERASEWRARLLCAPPYGYGAYPVTYSTIHGKVTGKLP